MTCRWADWQRQIAGLEGAARGRRVMEVAAVVVVIAVVVFVAVLVSSGSFLLGQSGALTMGLAAAIQAVVRQESLML